MTTTLGALANAEPILNELAKVKRPAKDRYHMGRLIAAVRAEIQHFQTEREALVRELGEEREATPMERQMGRGDTLFAVFPANIPEFVKRVNELAAVTVEIDDKWLLTPDLLKDDALSVDDEIALGDLFMAPPDYWLHGEEAP
jgi:hypothetical protein